MRLRKKGRGKRKIEPEQRKAKKEPETVFIFFLILGLLGTAEQTSSSGRNKTCFLTCGRVPRDCRGFTNVLMVTTTVRLVEEVSILHAGRWYWVCVVGKNKKCEI